ncbi:MAG: polyprenyl synthetase family protein [Acidobacteria bacterium]|nr:polyprenyl synthetase family protein [Acidobacteriota bacterium]MBP7473779.1 polyprenyl synthetase family protein [Pyrinomonadaceae bacterium]MBP9110304.1 polyprenyl synthetase family protein [Pyrinomonadaceae bacterium]
MADLDTFLAEVRREVDQMLDLRIPNADVEPTILHEAIRWSVFAGGKRIRPALVCAVGRAFGAESAALSQTAAAIEMIHTYSLIHDDLPAMDDDDLRRGQLTCHKKFGEATAILAGDVLQTLAFKVIADDDGLSPELRIRIISLIADASGTPWGMVAGQQLDLSGEGRRLSVGELENVHNQKTGALIAAAACSGAMIGGATDDEISSVRRFATDLGLLFQVTDDLLDVTQETETLGKTAGKDAVSKKATYPGLYGVEGTRELAAKLLADACLALDLLDRDTALLSEIADAIAGRNR